MLADTQGGVVGIAAIGVTESTADLEGVTRAYVGEGVTINAGSASVLARAATPPGADSAHAHTFLINIGTVGVSDLNAAAKIGQTVEAFVGPEAGSAATNAQSNITLGGGTLSVHALSTNNASSELDGPSVGAITIGVSSNTTNLDGATNAYVGGHVTIGSGHVAVMADSTNTATPTTNLVSVGAINGTGPHLAPMPAAT